MSFSCFKMANNQATIEMETESVNTATVTSQTTEQPGPLSLVEECRGLALIGRECGWRQLSYAIKNQLVASKAPYQGLWNAKYP